MGIGKKVGSSLYSSLFCLEPGIVSTYPKFLIFILFCFKTSSSVGFSGMGLLPIAILFIYLSSDISLKEGGNLVSKTSFTYLCTVCTVVWFVLSKSARVQ